MLTCFQAGTEMAADNYVYTACAEWQMKPGAQLVLMDRTGGADAIAVARNICQLSRRKAYVVAVGSCFALHMCLYPRQIVQKVCERSGRISIKGRVQCQEQLCQVLPACVSLTLQACQCVNIVYVVTLDAFATSKPLAPQI